MCKGALGRGTGSSGAQADAVVPLRQQAVEVYEQLVRESPDDAPDMVIGGAPSSRPHPHARSRAR